MTIDGARGRGIGFALLEELCRRADTAGAKKRGEWRDVVLMERRSAFVA